MFGIACGNQETKLVNVSWLKLAVEAKNGFANHHWIIQVFLANPN
jgi:hypothetical protein